MIGFRLPDPEQDEDGLSQELSTPGFVEYADDEEDFDPVKPLWNAFLVFTGALCLLSWGFAAALVFVVKVGFCG